MILPYFQNNCGVSLSEDEFQDIKHPYAECYSHITIKTVQLGSTFGTLLFGPLFALAKKPTRNVNGIISKSTRAGRFGIVIGLFAGPAMTYLKFRDQSAESVYDRAYRLRKNRTQVFSDQGYFLGGALGLAASTAMKTCPVFGALIGSSTGLVGVGLYNNVLNPKK